MFGMPSSTFWVARRYNLPFLAVVLNNGGSHLQKGLTIGWNAPKASALGIDATGYASRSTLEELYISFEPAADYGKIAEAAGAWGKTIQDINHLESGLQEAVKAVQTGQAAVVNVVVQDG